MINFKQQELSEMLPENLHKKFPEPDYDQLCCERRKKRCIVAFAATQI